MRGVISAPRHVVSGAFTVRVDFIREVELTPADIFIETLEGDPLGHTKDAFGGAGNRYHLLCYLPVDIRGKSRFTVLGHEVEPIEISYDTRETVDVTWGTPFRRDGKPNQIEIPISLSEPVLNLRKHNFRCSAAARCDLYGTGSEYQLVVHSSAAFTVTATGTVEKADGLTATLTEAVIEIQEVEG
ncbi:MAG: hypothetical protein OXU51_01095 [Candidatus Poribacteria bacterium]|nr:hypothetical protein [Candidatus Poribacteria bacterium]